MSVYTINADPDKEVTKSSVIQNLFNSILLQINTAQYSYQPITKKILKIKNEMKSETIYIKPLMSKDFFNV